MSPLNPQAAEFFPHRQHHRHHYHYHRTMPLPRYAASIVYYPHPSLFRIHRQLSNTYVPPPMPHEAEPVPAPVSFQVNSELEQQQKEVVDDDGDQNAIVQNHVFKVLTRRMQQHRRRPDHRFRQPPRFAWRVKGNEEEGQQNQTLRTGKVAAQPNHHDRRRFMIFNSKKKRCRLTPVRPDGDQTTVMIKNIPSKYTRNMLIEFLDKHCLRENEMCNENGTGSVLSFDFVYLPIDFRTWLNKGYAFVNFTDADAAWRFSKTASNMKWDLFQSNKIREVVAARLQGKENLEKHFGSTNFPCESEEVLPVFFCPPRDGTVKGVQRTVGKLVKH